MVEWTALEMRRTLTGTLGSNPSLSAKEESKSSHGTSFQTMPCVVLEHLYSSVEANNRNSETLIKSSDEE